MKILVCGSRNWTDEDAIRNAITKELPVSEIIHGGARGADTIVGQVAAEMGVPVKVFKADWDRHGKAAGPIRNKQMLDESKPDAVLAFPLGESKGTWHMIRIAKNAGVRVTVYGDNPY